MARGDESRRASATSVDEAKLLYQSLDQYNQDQDDKRRPSIILTALIILFLSAAGGIALAIVLMVEFEDIGAASLPRDVILFAAILSLLYIVLHLRGAKRSYKRDSMGPPQLRGHYLHASALLVARLGIACWTIALTVTVVMIARDLPDEGFLAKVPWLDLVICIGAIPSCIIISVTIERNRTPFATTAISSPAFLSCRVSEYADDEDRITDLSVSRRPSFNRQKRDSPSEKTVVTLPSAAIFQLGDMARYEKVLAKAKRKSNNKKHKSAPAAVENLPSMDEKEESLLPVFKTGGPLSSNPPSPRMSMDQTQAHADPAVPEPTYCPGGWRTEWNNVAHEVGVQSLPESVADDASSIWPSPYRPQETPAETPTRSSTPMTTISHRTKPPKTKTSSA
ncbi:hypothetical protein F4808DRAFT_432750 [Astrocystis sublimbata]|nr:hypothetical protein F4808DRAFT_432750 [Astrocystis sublimbata]